MKLSSRNTTSDVIFGYKLLKNGRAPAGSSLGDLFAHRELFDSIDADGSGIIHKSVPLA